MQNRREWKTRVLFRSLEVACQAARVPAVGTRTPTIHDVGIGLALWVSAFEILSHPKEGDATRTTVLDLLETAAWKTSKLKARRFKIWGPKKTIRRISLVQKLYCELYRARNDFLHGNRVTASKLFPLNKSGGPTLLHCAPLIYRAALLETLPLKPRKTRKSDFATQWAAWRLANMGQSQYEKAVLQCRPMK